jgi:hypothetical protein
MPLAINGHQTQEVAMKLMRQMSTAWSRRLALLGYLGLVLAVGPLAAAEPSGFPYIDPAAVQAARQRLVQVTHHQIGTAGAITVSYPQGWLVQKGPTGLEVRHPDGMARYVIDFGEVRPGLTPDMVFRQVYLPTLQRDMPDARVLESAPTASGTMYGLVGTYRGRPVYTILELAVMGFITNVAVLQGIQERLPTVVAIAQTMQGTAAGQTPPIGGGTPGGSGTGSSGSNIEDIKSRCWQEAGFQDQRLYQEETRRDLPHSESRRRDRLYKECLARHGVQ